MIRAFEGGNRKLRLSDTAPRSERVQDFGIECRLVVNSLGSELWVQDCRVGSITPPLIHQPAPLSKHRGQQLIRQKLQSFC